MRANGIVFLTIIAASTAFAASAAGQMRNPVMGSGTPNYPTVNIRGGPGAKWPTAVEDYNKGVAALRAKKYNDAIASFNRALRGAPKDSSVWTMLGLAKEGAGDLDGAREAYAKAVGFNEANIAARQRLGVTAAKLGQTDEARAEVAELQKRLDGCVGRCTDRDRLQAAIAGIQDAIAHSAAVPPPG